MQDRPIDLNTFATALMDAANRTVLQSMEGLTDEQVYYRPSEDTNSIGWLAWHLSRWKDRYGALALDEPQVWVAQRWAERFGFEPERTGMGDTPEQVAEFRPARELLLGYVEAAHAATVERIGRISVEQFEKPFAYVPGGQGRPTWRALVGTTMDFAQHTGQIAYLRGLISGMGWR